MNFPENDDFKSSPLNIFRLYSIGISLASPKSIKEWAIKSGGEDNEDPLDPEHRKVLNAKTFNYKNLKPEKGGLFCEQIFGPLKTLQRRYKLGYIELVSPVTHIWYLKGATSYISIRVIRYLRKKGEGNKRR